MEVTSLPSFPGKREWLQRLELLSVGPPGKESAASTCPTSRHSTGRIKGCWVGFELPPKLAVKKWKGRQVNMHVLIWKIGNSISVCSRGWFRLQYLDLDLKHFRYCACLGVGDCFQNSHLYPGFDWVCCKFYVFLALIERGKKRGKNYLSAFEKKSYW